MFGIVCNMKYVHNLNYSVYKLNTIMLKLPSIELKYTYSNCTCNHIVGLLELCNERNEKCNCLFISKL